MEDEEFSSPDRSLWYPVAVSEDDHGTAGQAMVQEMYMLGKPGLQKSFKSFKKPDDCLLHESSARIGGVTEQIHFDTLKLGKHCKN